MLDQHFMIDKDILKEVAESADLLPTDEVLEIGPGHGELTRLLCRKVHVTAVELDPILVKEFPKLGNIKVVEGNILQVWDKQVFNKLVGNIPYAISEPLLWLILKKQLERVVLVVGKDFADILLSSSKLGVLTKEFYNLKEVRIIPKKAFSPAPRVDSALIVLTPKKAENIMLRELVWQSDKKVKNALEKSLAGSLTKRQVKERISGLGKIGEKSVTQLSKKEFDELQTFLNNKI